MNENNVPLPTIVQRLSTTGLIDDQSAISGSVVISRQLSPAQDNLILARYTVSDDRSLIEQTHGELRMIREAKLIGDLRSRIAEAAVSSSFELVDGLKIDVGNTASVELLSSDDPRTGIVPRYEIRLSARNRGHLGGTSPLVMYGKPSFESVEQAVRVWIGLRPFHGNSDARIGSILIEVPLSAPRLGAIAIDGQQTMRIEIAGMPSKMPLELTGVWQSGDGAFIEPFAQNVVGDSIDIPRPSWADQVAVWLVRADSLIIDFFFENPNRCSRSRRVLFPPSVETNGSELAVLAQIHSGEGESLEFKPFLEPGSKKFDELIKTVIAFANKRGGSIYLGVSDHQEILGIEKELWEFTPNDKKASLESCTAWYSSFVRKKICDQISQDMEFSVDPTYAGEKLLMRVVVKEGKNKPYSDVRGNNIWTRRGSNSVRPTSEELKQWILDGTRPKGLFG